MTIEEKARAYDKALKWMRELYPGLHGATKEDAEHYFPELRESEDERIRTFLHHTFTAQYLCKDKTGKWHGEPVTNILSYLEKQNHDGKKWITPAELNRLETLRYEAGYKAGFNVGVHSEAEKQKEQKSRDYCSVRDEFDLDGNLKQKDHFRDDTKMVELQDYSGLNDLERAIHRGFLSAGVENAPVTLIKETAKECLEQMKPSEINIRALLSADRLASAEMTGRLKERSEILENPEEYGLHKPSEWSEEDEKMIETICKEGDLKPSEQCWLKSLRPVKQEWSKKDEDKLYQVMEILLADKTVALRETPHCKALHEAYDEMLAWLKSLRPVSKESLQPHWKPSEEQMNVLRKLFIEGVKALTQTDYNTLNSIYLDLKKLI